MTVKWCAVRKVGKGGVGTKSRIIHVSTIVRYGGKSENQDIVSLLIYRRHECSLVRGD